MDYPDIPNVDLQRRLLCSI